METKHYIFSVLLALVSYTVAQIYLGTIFGWMFGFLAAGIYLEFIERIV